MDCPASRAPRLDDEHVREVQLPLRQLAERGDGVVGKRRLLYAPHLLRRDIRRHGLHARQRDEETLFGKARTHRTAPVDPQLLKPHDAAVAVVGRRRLPYAAARVAPARHLGATRYHGPVPRANPLDRGTGLAGVLRPEFKRTPQRVVPRGDLDAPGRLVAAGPGGANSLKRLLRRKPFGRNAHYPHRAFANAACGCRGKQGGKDESACISHLRATPPSVRMHGES